MKLPQGLMRYVRYSLAVIGGGMAYVGAIHCSLMISERDTAIRKENMCLRNKIRKNGYECPSVERALETIGVGYNMTSWRNEIKLPWYNFERIVHGAAIIVTAPCSAVQLIERKRVNTKLRALLKEQDDEFISFLREKNTDKAKLLQQAYSKY